MNHVEVAHGDEASGDEIDKVYRCEPCQRKFRLEFQLTPTLKCNGINNDVDMYFCSTEERLIHHIKRAHRQNKIENNEVRYLDC